MKLKLNSLRLAALTTLCLGGIVSAQVMDQIPQSALVVLKINHLRATSDKVAKMSNDLGLAAFVPQLADPLAAVEQAMEFKGGIDETGDVALAFLDPTGFGNDPEKSLIGLIPVSDYDAFVKGLPNAKTDGAITEISEPEPHFCMKWGKYAAFSPNKDVLTGNAPKGLKLPARAMKEIDSRDAAVYANLVALRTKLLPQLQQQRGEWVATLEDAMKNAPQGAKYTPVFKAVANQALNMAERFLTDADAATLGLTIAPEGINTNLMAEFTPDSYLGKSVSSFKNTDKPLLEGLPEGKYLFYGGSMIDPAALSKFVNDMIDPVAKEIAADPEMKGAADYIDSFKALIAAQKGSSFGLLAPSGAIGVDPLLQMFAVYQGDSKVIMSSFAKMVESQQSFMKSMPGGVASTHTAAAKTLDGVSFDQITTKFDSNAQDPAAVQQAQIMAMLYGPNGAVANYGPIGDKVLLASGVSDAEISSAIAAVKKGDAPLAAPDKVKAVAGQLPKERLSVIYVGLDDIVSTAMNYARQFGAGLNVQLPPDLPPVGTTIATDGPAVRIDSHIPTSLVQSLVAAGIQAKMQMGGGAPPAGGGM